MIHMIRYKHGAIPPPFVQGRYGTSRCTLWWLRYTREHRAEGRLIRYQWIRRGPVWHDWRVPWT